MRFDDMIATVLAQPADGPDRLEAQWRQLVDLLAQRRAARHGREDARAYEYLRRRRSQIDPAVRAEAARALAGLAIDAEMVVFFAEDERSVAAPLLQAVRLDAAEWLSILPRLATEGRLLLDRRSDLPDEVVQALRGFGAGGRVPDSISPASATSARSESQLRELVDRIEAYRRSKEEHPHDAEPPDADQAFGFRWETGTDGIFRWVDGAPREALVGQSLAVIAGPGQHGVDGQATGAFEKRSSFRDARLSVAGEGPSSGDWRISGVPFFDPARGAFLGYRGTARRPRIHEVARHAAMAAPGLFGTRLPADSLRQLIHELRTPLNAILGFAEMIEGEYMGPAAAPHRERATGIISQARRLLSAVDDLDTAARIETHRLEREPGPVDAAALIRRLHESCESIAAQRGASLVLAIAPDLPPARVDAETIERMFARLLATTIGLAEKGETIEAAMASERRADRIVLRLAIGRPRAVEGLDEADLLDPGYGPEGNWPGAPALGLGFALRLVRSLAEAEGGGLVIGEERILLHLPALAEAPAIAAQGEGRG